MASPSLECAQGPFRFRAQAIAVIAQDLKTALASPEEAAEGSSVRQGCNYQRTIRTLRLGRSTPGGQTCVAAESSALNPLLAGAVRPLDFPSRCERPRR